LPRRPLLGLRRDLHAQLADLGDKSWDEGFEFGVASFGFKVRGTKR
jgi:hypothetical protein